MIMFAIVTGEQSEMPESKLLPLSRMSLMMPNDGRGKGKVTDGNRAFAAVHALTLMSSLISDTHGHEGRFGEGDTCRITCKVTHTCQLNETPVHVTG